MIAIAEIGGASSVTAHYEFVCKQNGIKVAYSYTKTKAHDPTMPSMMARFFGFFSTEIIARIGTMMPIDLAVSN